MVITSKLVTEGWKRGRDDSPCDSYAGNLCGGFGAPTICFTCGWTRAEHMEAFKELFYKKPIPENIILAEE